ncbi:MAG TPA: aldehyde dehydrogenase family protein, partial [Gemmatimonadaceae bacterium]|nr:aldehyde dehydrogenase family protein [Gemmatimonadaceae bacterium]
MTTVKDIFETMEWGPAPESDTPVQAWLAKFNGEFGHYINGRWTEPKESRLFDVMNPATTKLLARVSHGTTDDVDDAVEAAAKALPAWRALTPHERARH